MDSVGGLVCPLCPREHTCHLKFSLREYLLHIKLFHSHQPGFHIICGIGGCERTFCNFRTYENHISSYHRGELHPTNQVSGCSGDSPEICGGDDDDGNTGGSNEDLDDGNLSVVPELSTLQRSSALFLISAKENHKLTQTALQGVIDGVTGLCQGRLSAMHSAVHKVLTSAGISPTSISGLDDIFDPEGEFGRPFFGLETQYQQLKFYRMHFQFVEPVRVVLGERRVCTGVGVKRRAVIEEQTMMYVPILQTLQVLLQNEAIVAEIENGHKSQTEYLEDFCDGKVFASHPLFSIHLDALQIFFYYDDLEVCNPLGSKAKIHKLGIFYFTLGNLPPKFRSKLSAIQLVAIVEVPVMTAYGMDAVLRPFVTDVKKLEAGYEFEVNSTPKVLYGTVAAVSADNLGSLALGGFKESSSAHRCCRQCLATREDSKKMFLEHQFTLRCKETHIEHIAQLEGDVAVLEGEGTDDPSKLYGINRDSILNELTYFHVCSGGLIPDIMHDILEGALQYEIKLMLKVFIIDEKYITLNELNRQLEFFELGYMESKDRPSPISDATIRAHTGSSKNTLKQTAAQLWLFGRVLPLMIGDKIPEDDDHWANFLRMMEIVDRLFCPTLEDDDAAYLQALISDHHQEFCHIYPDESIIPKMHFMVHMPRLMIQYGPLVRHWTMRYEAKHSYFKKLAQSMGNFINLPYSLAMRHQLLQCYNSTNDADVLGDGLTVGPGSVVSSATLEELNESSAFEARWIKFNGVTYKKGAGIIHSVNRMPQVAQITAIYVVQGRRVVFQVHMFTTDYYTQHLRAYVVKPSYTYVFTCIDDLILPNPIHIRTVCRKTLFILPHHVKTDD